MEKVASTLTNQNAIKETFKLQMERKDYIFLTENEFAKLNNIPEKYVIINSKYRGIYGANVRSQFKVVNRQNNIVERIEITYQQKSGSVDEKFPYYYMNSVQGHDDKVIMLIDGGGYKPVAKKWVKDMIEKRWLMSDSKEILLLSLADFLVYIENEY